MKLKYRIKQYEELLTRWKGTEKLSERVETIYQVEFRQYGFWGILIGWSERGECLFTEEEARERIEYYKRLDRERPPKKRIVYTNID